MWIVDRYTAATLYTERLPLPTAYTNRRVRCRDKGSYASKDAWSTVPVRVLGCSASTPTSESTAALASPVRPASNSFERRLASVTAMAQLRSRVRLRHLAKVSLSGRPFGGENGVVVALRRRSSMVRGGRRLAGRWSRVVGPSLLPPLIFGRARGLDSVPPVRLHGRPRPFPDQVRGGVVMGDVG